MDKAQTEVADAIRKVWPDVNPAMAFSYAGIAIACLRERWTSDAAIRRAMDCYYAPLRDMETADEVMQDVLTAAMRDSE